MSKRKEKLNLDKKHFDNFKRHLPFKKKLCKKTVNMMLKNGIIDVSTAFEVALSNIGDTDIISEIHADFQNGCDAKLVTSRKKVSKNGKVLYTASIGKIKNKTGNLLVQVYEQFSGKFYYFSIPHSAYSPVINNTKKGSIDILFNNDGTPRRETVNKLKYENWWYYEVNNLKELRI